LQHDHVTSQDLVEEVAMKLPSGKTASPQMACPPDRGFTTRAGGPAWRCSGPALLVAATVLAALPRLASAQYTGGGDIRLPLALAFDGAHVWVANNAGWQDQLGSVTELSAADGSRIATLQVLKPMALVFDGAHIWVADSDLPYASEVTELDAGSGAVVASYGGGDIQDPRALVFDGTHIWVANGNYALSTVTELKVSDGSEVGTFTGGGTIDGPLALAFDGTHIWVANCTGQQPNQGDYLTELKASDGSKVGTFDAGGDIQCPDALLFDGAHVWIANLTGNSVTKLRASDGAKLGTFTANGDIYLPTALAFDGSHVWVANGNGLPGKGNSVTELDAASGAKVTTFTDGIAFPTALVFDGAHIWVANANSNSLTVIPPLGSCAAGPNALCLGGNRFLVTAEFDAGASGSGAAQAVGITADTGYLWFFDASSVEAVVKVLDACTLDNHYWFFAGGLTDVNVVITVTDTKTGLSKSYTNPAGTPFLPIQDTAALAVCP
jgi:DNA-binding beta-propeller fold protein YncE